MSPSSQNLESLSVQLEQNSLAGYKPAERKRSERSLKLQAHAETCNYLKVNAWFAYPNYGIGYLLSSGTFGVLFPDKSALFYNPIQT